MVKKILKIQSFLIFTISLINYIYFAFASQLPDNLYTISSSQQSYDFITYNLISFLVLISYFSGIWISLSYFLNAFLNSFVFREKSKKRDVLTIFFNLGFFLGLSYFIFPSFLGEGLREWLEKSFKSWQIMLSTCFFAAAFILNFIELKFFTQLKQKIVQPLVFISDLKRFVGLLLRFVPFKRNKKVDSSQTSFKQHYLNFVEKNFDELRLDDSLISQRDSTIFKDEQHHQSVNDEEHGEREYHEHHEHHEHHDNHDHHHLSLELENLTQTSQKSLDTKSFPEDEMLLLSRSEAKVLETVSFSVSEQMSYDQKSDDLISFMTMNKVFKKERENEDEYFERIIHCLEEKFKEFKINGRIVNVLQGPVVDTFELELGAGVKVSKITSVTEDLSLALCGVLIRIVYPMKGKSTLGIEIPRDPREIILLGEILSSNNFKNSHSPLPLAIGKNAFGEVFVADLASMPHMLVAGSTGAGKSVFINNLLVSLLVKKSPQQMRLLLIDPKQLELSLYSTLPHLLLPVVTDPLTTSLALQWACEEMDSRYSLLKEMGVRNIENFNEKFQKLSKSEALKLKNMNTSLKEDAVILPYIVIIVDEFADLILSRKGKEIEESICRLAAKARACGIHLVIATQRPSVDVITGLIKSNFPTRISFRVTSSTDSRTILNSLGPEKLLGKGDMLYKYGVETMRLHSAFVDEYEIEEFIRRFDFAPIHYDEKAMAFINKRKREESFGNETYHLSKDKNVDYRHSDDGIEQEIYNDDLYEEALKVVVENKVASASMLQRKLKIGYNRAANLVEVLEADGVVGPQQGSKPRKVLVQGENFTS